MFFAKKPLSQKVLQILSKGDYITRPKVSHNLDGISLSIYDEGHELFELCSDASKDSLIQANPSYLIINNSARNMNLLCGARSLLQNKHKFENSRVHFSIRNLQFSQYLNSRLKQEDLIYDAVHFYHLAKSAYSAMYDLIDNPLSDLEVKIDESLKKLKLIT